jgi:hypothetical protein
MASEIDSPAEEDVEGLRGRDDEDEKRHSAEAIGGIASDPGWRSPRC